jgi:hypothetical protein
MDEQICTWDPIYEKLAEVIDGGKEDIILSFGRKAMRHNLYVGTTEDSYGRESRWAYCARARTSS